MGTELLDMKSPDSLPAKVERGAMMPAQSTEIGRLIDRAITEKMPAAELTKLYDLYERQLDRSARMAFNAAKVAFQIECPDVLKTRASKEATDRGSGFGYMYANRADLLDVARPVLLKHGLTVDWSVEDDQEGKPHMVCYLRHIDGHFETAKFPFHEDATGFMKGIQKAGSGMEYAMRYTLVMATGLVSRDDDTDGVDLGERIPITEKQAQSLNDQIIQESVNLGALLRMLGNLKSLNEITQGDQLATAERIIDEKRRALRAAKK